MSYLEYYDNLSETEKLYLEIISHGKIKMNDDYFSLIKRLTKVSMWCGMIKSGAHIDYPKYDFVCDISRAFHSISVANMANHFKSSEELYVASIVHDIGTPAFAHVVDYVLGDFLFQEKTEDFNYEALRKNSMFQKKSWHFPLEKISVPSNYPLLDNDRPRLCLDRLDGIFLASLFWCKTLSLDDIYYLYNDLVVTLNEDNEPELTFKHEEYARMLFEKEEIVSEFTTSDNDKQGMFGLTNVLKYALSKKYFNLDFLKDSYDEEVFYYLDKLSEKDKSLKELLENFYHPMIIRKNEVATKKRRINPLIIGGRRLYEE